VNDHECSDECGTKVYATISKARKAAKKVMWGSIERRLAFTSNWASFCIREWKIADGKIQRLNDKDVISIVKKFSKRNN
jgi:hypothetical protein